MLCGTLCGVEMGLARQDVPHARNGVGEALAWLQQSATGTNRTAEKRAA